MFSGINMIKTSDQFEEGKEGKERKKEDHRKGRMKKGQKK